MGINTTVVVLNDALAQIETKDKAMGTDADALIPVAQALEQKRALAIVADIAAMGDFFTSSDEFRAGWDSACEEITERLRTEVWTGCLPPIDASKTIEANAEHRPETKA